MRRALFFHRIGPVEPPWRMSGRPGCRPFDKTSLKGRVISLSGDNSGADPRADAQGFGKRCKLSDTDGHPRRPTSPRRVRQAEGRGNSGCQGAKTPRSEVRWLGESSPQSHPYLPTLASWRLGGQILRLRAEAVPRHRPRHRHRHLRIRHIFSAFRRASEEDGQRWSPQDPPQPRVETRGRADDDRKPRSGAHLVARLGFWALPHDERVIESRRRARAPRARARTVLRGGFVVPRCKR